MRLPRRLQKAMRELGCVGVKNPILPVKQPMKFEFVINLKTAKALNLDIPQSVLFRATRIIR